MRAIPLPIEDLELRDRLSGFLTEALGHPERAAPIYGLRSFLRLIEAQDCAEVPCGTLSEAVHRALNEVGLGACATDAIEALLNSELLRRRESEAGEQRVAPDDELERGLPAATSRVEAYCRALEELSRRRVRSAAEMERALGQAACLFNEGLFFEVHEVLEPVWLRRGDRARQLLQGLIQIAVGFHHLENRNIKGALSLLKEGVEKVRDYRPTHLGLELIQFLEQVAACALSIESLGREAFDQFDRGMIPRMRLRE
jgi:predicted metal-dependent hydrolase